MSLFHLTATPDSIPSRTAPERATLTHSSCTRTLLRLRASSLLATQPASASQNPRGNAVLLSVGTDNQASTGTPPAVTPACIRTIAALTSLARRLRNGPVAPPSPESCTPRHTGSWQYKPEKECVCHDVSAPEQLTPSHETAVHGPTVIRHAHRRSRPGFRSAYRLPRLPNAPIGVENPFFVQLEVNHVSVTDWTHWSPAFDCGGGVRKRP